MWCTSISRNYFTSVSRNYFRLSCMPFYRHKREIWIACNSDRPGAKLIKNLLIKNQLNYICQFCLFKLAEYFIRYATGLTLVWWDLVMMTVEKHIYKICGSYQKEKGYQHSRRKNYITMVYGKLVKWFKINMVFNYEVLL